MKTYAIIPAGGKGLRSGSTIPKQYVKINGKELIVYTLEVFQKNKLVDEIIISAAPGYFKLLNKLKEKYRLTKISQIVEGGRKRQDSVFNGLSSLNLNLTRNLNLNPNPNPTPLDRTNPIKIKSKITIKTEKPNSNDLIIVHDAARPLLPQSVLTKAIETAKKNGNALVCIRAKDTLIKGNMFVDSYMDRDEVYYVQTPQIFPYYDLMTALKKAYEEKFTGTDESMLIQRAFPAGKQAGKKINITEGSVLNFKVTTMEDLNILKKLLK